MSQKVVRRLRPYLFTNFRRLQCRSSRRPFSASSPLQKQAKGETHDRNKRVQELGQTEEALAQCYPRLRVGLDKRTAIKDFRTQHESLENNQTGDGSVYVAGRVQSVRRAGSKLMFVDLKQGDYTVQAVCDVNRFVQNDSTSSSAISTYAKLIRKGDWYQFHGHPHRTRTGELSILATSQPELLSPSLHQIPEKLQDDEFISHNRHVDMLVHPEAIQTLKVRHLIDNHLNAFFTDSGFTKVQTPILSAGAGGAIARPFETKATESPDETLNLRIAPELWLKRMVVGGLEKVYEIGPAFRNEGVDATHNPEFYTCEFYEAFATLEDLMRKTEELLGSMAEAVEKVRETQLGALEPPKVDFAAPFQRLEFIPTVEREMGCTLPNLSDPDADQQLLSISKEKNIDIPANATLPRLLDALASHFIEPLCKEPTFVTHHPVCLSPLSRHFNCPNTGQIISARAELFIAGREYANMYEEENNPFEQRRKFEAQNASREEHHGVDESYIEALEWGLPPTGGWGCGIDRLVMLFAGRDRIGDVLSSGTVRNVVGMSKGRR